MTKDEIIIYQANDQSTVLEVRVEDETVWLNRNQIVLLFARDIKTIGKYINNVLKEELRDFSVIAKFATTASDGKIYQVEYYNDTYEPVPVTSSTIKEYTHTHTLVPSFNRTIVSSPPGIDIRRLGPTWRRLREQQKQLD